MLLATKAQISKATLYILCFVTAFLLLGIVTMVICAGLAVNPFKESTSGFLEGLFGALIGVSIVSLFLNVATNLSLIADAKIAELKIKSDKGQLVRWFYIFLGICVALTVLIGGSAYLSKQSYLSGVLSQANEIVAANGEMIKKIGLLLEAAEPNNKEHYEKAAGIVNFLSSQRKDLPYLTLIFDSPFEGKRGLYKISENDVCFGDRCEKGKFEKRYYRCEVDIDCAYLKSFFEGQETSIMQKLTIDDDQFYIYVPFVMENNRRFVLLFNKHNRYGSLGYDKRGPM